jgi:hypothetical protein
VADEPIEAAQSTSSNEPFDVWLPKYLAEIEKSVAAAEQHLKVSAGTISSIKGDPDFVAALKTFAVIETMLNELIAEHPPQRPYEGGPLGGPPQTSLGPDANENFRTFVVKLPMGRKNGQGKLSLATGLGLLTQQQADFIEGVASVRNRYAHNVQNMERSFKDILTEEHQHDKKIIERVTGLQEVTTEQLKLENGFLKMLMYHGLANYLADVLHTLHPPRRPGLLELLANPQLSMLDARDTPIVAKVAQSGTPDVPKQ